MVKGERNFKSFSSMGFDPMDEGVYGSHDNKEGMVNMDKNCLNIKCFIASPGDLHDERKIICSVIDHINSRNAAKGNIVLSPILWERQAVPDVGADAQTILNKQLKPDGCQIVIVVFGGRIGTATPRAQSGTVEEFLLAYKQFELGGDVKIHMYFKEKLDISLDDVEASQLDELKKFKSSIESKGILYSKFTDSHDLWGKIDLALTSDIDDYISSVNGTEKITNNIGNSNLSTILETRLKTSLTTLGYQPAKWVSRRLCMSGSLPTSLVSTDPGIFTDIDILPRSENFVINAPSQFGLTSLSHYLVLEAWKRKLRWAYVDLKAVKLRKINAVLDEAKAEFGSTELDCIVIDSWVATHPQAQRLFEYLDATYPKARIILMQTNLDAISLPKPVAFKSKRDFVPLQLLPLRKEDVRIIVSDFVKRVDCSQEDMLNKVIAEIDALNIHRTPMNCCTLLTVAERNFHDSPINRAVMLDQVLFVLFNLHEIPSYSIKPDVKDCEFLFGAISEWMIRNGLDSFKEDEFRAKAKECCDKHMVDIDIECMFNILKQNGILVKVYGNVYRFGASFWLYYFAAKRMELDNDFRSFILSDHRYSLSPDIIEFYTGSSRAHSDILTILCDDLEKTKTIMDEKIGMRRNINPLSLLKWAGSDADLARMREKLKSDIDNSNLPPEIKDRHSDANYKYLKPFDQTLDQYIESVSYCLFERQLKSLSRALRNSDFADADVRRRAMALVMSAWQEIAKILFIIAPGLAVSGHVVFGGTKFLLDETWNEDRSTNDQQHLFTKILTCIPLNVLSMAAPDVASQKLAKLFYYVLEGSPSELLKHLIMRYLVAQRPNGWDSRVHSYICQIGERSFYQADIRSALHTAMKYDNVSVKDMGHLKTLYIEATSRFTGRSKNLLRSAPNY